MTWLDCRTWQSALTTVAASVGAPEDQLAAAIRTGEPDFSGSSQVDPVESFPKEILRQFGAELDQVALDGALLFHGTRLTDPESVMRGGLQPLSQRLEAIWKTLGDLAQPETDDEDWREFRHSVETDGGDHDGSLYRMKAGDAMHHGPSTVLVRDIVTRPSGSHSHDYLDCPEIVQDICRCHNARSAGDLEGRFKEATEPCIVTVRQSQVDNGVLGTAIRFIRSELLGMPPGLDCAGGSGRPPEPIPPSDVVAVDVYRGPRTTG